MCIGVALALASPALGQSRITQMPGYDRYVELSPQIPDAVVYGTLTPTWRADSNSFDYTAAGHRWRYSLTRKRFTDLGPTDPAPRVETPSSPGAPAETLMLARGRGADANVISPDGAMRAFSRNRNLYIAPTGGEDETAITTDGGVESRILNGVGSYVYLEEFNVRSPVWWSPDGRKLAWMRYDEGPVPDYYLQLDQTKPRSSILTEAYPHPGEPNPVADLYVYDLAAKSTVRMDVRDGQAFGDDVVGHYVWNASWTKDGAELLVRRTDRRQKTIDLAACSPTTGACRTVVRESRPQSWAYIAHPVFLKDGKRFIWASDRDDFRNLYLYDLGGRQIVQLTHHAFDVGEVVRVDEKTGWVWYMARSGDNYMKMQLHRVRLDGSGDERLTDPALHHKVFLSPDGQHFLDTAQTHDMAPITTLMDASGRKVADISRSDLTKFDALGLKRAELFTFLSADGVTPLHGLIQFPSNFDPAKRYPVLLSVYGGPNSSGVNESFAAPNPLCEFGFLIVKLDARSAEGKGRKPLDAMYKAITIAEVDDFAAGLKALRARPYVDASRVGAYGTSYGGTVSAALLMRYPDVVQAANSNSPVTDYRLYDTAYSERFLGLPQTDGDAYDRAALLTYVDGLRGDLLLYYGTSDDNVHPKNTMQLIRALQRAGKSFDVQVGPDRGHTGVDPIRMMEFFIERLVMDRPPEG